MVKVLLFNTGSSAGSSVSSMSSNNNGRPTRMEFSSERSRFTLLSLVTSRLFRLSMLRTHCLAWPCGSIISGHRSPRCTSNALSVLTSSVGRPCSCHSRTSTGSPMACMRLKPSEHGTSAATTLDTQCCSSSAR